MAFAFCASKRGASAISSPSSAMPRRSPPENSSRPAANGPTTARTASSSAPGFSRPSPPTTVEGIEKYLGSGMIRGIGPVNAKKLVAAFREQVFDVIEAEPLRLQEVTGIGRKRAEAIIAGWAEQRAIREIMIFLHSHGVGTSRAVRISRPTAPTQSNSIPKTLIGSPAISRGSASARPTPLP